MDSNFNEFFECLKKREIDCNAELKYCTVKIYIKRYSTSAQINNRSNDSCACVKNINDYIEKTNRLLITIMIFESIWGGYSYKICVLRHES